MDLLLEENKHHFPQQTQDMFWHLMKAFHQTQSLPMEMPRRELPAWKQGVQSSKLPLYVCEGLGGRAEGWAGTLGQG